MELKSFSPPVLTASDEALRILTAFLGSYIHNTTVVYYELHDGHEDDDTDPALSFANENGTKIELLGCNYRDDHGRLLINMLDLTSRRVPESDCYEIATREKAREQGWLHVSVYDDEEDKPTQADVDFVHNIRRHHHGRYR